jgi:glycosyltransferase 2 family protein
MKKLVSLGVSAAILAILWFQVDVGQIWTVLVGADLALLTASIVLLVLLILASVVRLWALGRIGGFHLGLREALEATLAANALNLFLPGKMGDVLKAALMAEDDPARLPGALVLGIWEKLSELALLFVLASMAFVFAGGEGVNALWTGAAGVAGIGILLWGAPMSAVMARIPRMRPVSEAWSIGLQQLRARWMATGGILIFSTLIWAGHLAQVLLMAAALGVTGDAAFWALIAARVPIAILAGLVPLTFAGVGTRDAALVVLLGPLIGPEQAAALGVLFWLRYLVPGVLGLPLLPRFMRAASKLAQKSVPSVR